MRLYAPFYRPSIDHLSTIYRPSIDAGNSKSNGRRTMELHFTVRERKVGGKTEYVIRLNDRVLRSYQEPPSQEEINTMLIAIKQALREYTNCLHALLGDGAAVSHTINYS
jgi:hypothetical protein